jgi:1,4-dihydroxy-6-naphthoate synthase
VKREKGEAGSYQVEMERAGINEQSVALPGEHTTANLLFSFAFPGAKNKKFMLFSAIEDAVLGGETDLGVIIHENRFTYAQKGLHKLMDLGEYWEEKMKMPIPLGGIAINQSVKRSVALKLNTLIRKSIEYAFSNYPVIPPYVREHAQEMDESVMRQHIDLYVNDYSRSLGDEGRTAIYELYTVFKRMNRDNSFVEPDELFI